MPATSDVPRRAGSRFYAWVRWALAAVDVFRCQIVVFANGGESDCAGSRLCARVRGVGSRLHAWVRRVRAAASPFWSQLAGLAVGGDSECAGSRLCAWVRGRCPSFAATVTN